MADPLTIKICGIKTEKHARCGDRRRRRHRGLHAFLPLAAPSRARPDRRADLARARPRRNLRGAVSIRTTRSSPRSRRSAPTGSSSTGRKRRIASRRSATKPGSRSSRPARSGRPRTSPPSRALPMPPTASCSTPSRPRAPTGRAGWATPSTGRCSRRLTPRCPSCFPGASRRIRSPPRSEASARSGVDVSSGVETAPGAKDAKLIAAFINNARQAAAS